MSTYRAKTARPKGRAVTRVWHDRQAGRVDVSVEHPTEGDLHRGTIRSLRRGQDPQARGFWSVVDYDHQIVADWMVGDYLDAEQQLLDATAELDEEGPP